MVTGRTINFNEKYYVYTRPVIIVTGKGTKNLLLFK